MRGADGAIEFWIGTATDIHDRKRIEEQRSFIVSAGDTLSHSLDYRETLRQVAELTAGDIADWCSVHIVEPDGAIAELAIAHRDPAKVTFARELQERYPAAADAPTGAPAVIRSGEPEIVSEITEEMLEAAAEDDLHLELLQQLGLSSYMCVPLKGRDAVLGAITLVASESGRRFGPEDLSLAEELARRAATAIENARLYREAEARAQAARVLATIGDGVFLVDQTGRVQLWNSAAQWITGLQEEDVLGKLAATAIPGWAEMQPRIPIARTGEAAQRREHPVAAERARAVALRLRGRARGGNRLRVSRPDRRAGARVDAPGSRRDRVARAAHPARGDLRRGADAPARATSTSSPSCTTSCSK